MFKVGEVVYLARNIEDLKEGAEGIIKEVKSDRVVLRIGNKEISVQYNEILKPCPFCGGMPSTYDFNDFAEIYCEKCFARTKEIKISAYYTAIDKAKERWNRRA